MKVGLFLFVVTILGCRDMGKSNHAVKDSSFISVDSSKSSKTSLQTDFTEDSVFTIQFPKDSSSVTVTSKMTGINKPLTVYIPIEKGNLLTLIIAAEDSAANVRINQLFTPDQKADGPFGKSLTRKITQQGNYKVIIGENLMQGEEWKGKFSLTVKVQ